MCIPCGVQQLVWSHCFMTWSYRFLHWTAVEFFKPCRTQAEMAHTCRGTIPLATAHIEVGETCHLVLTNGGRSYHLKATSEGECQRWVSALQKAKSSATLLMHHSGEVNISDFARFLSFRHISVVRPPDVWHSCHPSLEVWRNDRGDVVQWNGKVCVFSEEQYRPPV